jgi:hypothetical protein
MQEQLMQVLARSDQFEDAIHDAIGFDWPMQSRSAALAIGQALHSMELARAHRLLLREGLDASAMALVRVQFESTTRAVWLAGAATEEQLERYLTSTPGGELKGANQGPAVDDMLKAIGRGPAAHVASALQLLKDASWRAMNHYSHGSLIAVAQAMAPRQFDKLANAVLNSNCMLLMAANTSMIASAHRPADILRHIAASFADCLPPAMSTDRSPPSA